ncbi:MAG TPA: hypothetical protein VF077_09015 [Nitrospiraceae bacterium]
MRKTETTAIFTVKLNIPQGGNAILAQAYIRDAIQGWGGGLSPTHPFFKIEPDSFTVALKEKVTRYG